MDAIFPHLALTATARRPALSNYGAVAALDDEPGLPWKGWPADRLEIDCEAGANACYLENIRADQGRWWHYETSTVLTLSALSGTGQSSVLSFTTSTAHGLAGGESVILAEVNGTRELNGVTGVVQVLDTTRFSLKDSAGSELLGTGLSPYLSGGKVYRLLGSGTIDLYDYLDIMDFVAVRQRYTPRSWLVSQYSFAASRWAFDFQALGSRHGTITSWSGSGTSGRFLAAGLPVALPIQSSASIQVGDGVTFAEHTRQIIRIAWSGAQNIRLQFTVSHPYAVGQVIWITDTATRLDNRAWVVAAIVASDEIELGVTPTLGTAQVYAEPMNLGIARGQASRLFSLIKIVGDGTGTSGVQLDSSPGTTASVTGLWPCAQVGLAYPGTLQEITNPQAGLTESLEVSGGVQERRSDGSVHIEQGTPWRKFEGSLTVHRADALRIGDLEKAIGYQAFPCRLLSEMPDSPFVVGLWMFQGGISKTRAYASGEYLDLKFQLQERK